MGGTSTDISLISGGQASLSADGMLAAAHRTAQPRYRKHRAGGGSIAGVDASRTCGWDRKARARCRARPVTAMADWPRRDDANVVLAISIAAAFMAANAARSRGSEAAIDRVAKAMDLSRVEAAAASTA